MLRADVVATLAKVFNKPPVRADELLRQCAGVLANLSFDAEAHARMVADHGVRLIRRIMSAATSSAAAAAASDVPVSASAIGIIRETLRSCATACCNLAADALEKTPVLDMLIDLSASSYAPTILTCAIAFAKLASSATHRVLLTRCAELYPALTLMMRCGVEDIQIYSAVALCNLAVEPPAAKPVGVRHVWKEGTVPDFIVNALLRINSDSTKEICARALFNLLTHDELRAVHIKDGVLYALVKLARLESVEIRTLCVTALYNLSCDPALAETLMELKVAQVITKLCEMEFSSQEIHRKLAACLTNLASEPKPPSGKKVATTSDSAAGGSSSMAVRLVESGALVAMLVLCEHADPSTRHACAAALCFLSAYRVNCEAMATLGLVDVLTKKLLLAPPDAETSESESDNPGMELEQRQQHEFALNALCNISCFPALHDRFEEAGAVAQITRVLAANASRERNEESEDQEDETMVLACVQTLGNLTFHARHRRALLTHGLIPTLLSRAQVLRCSHHVGDVCAEIVATLCEDALHWNELIATGAVRVLREITEVDGNAEPPLLPSQVALRASIYALSQLARCEKSGEAVIAHGALDVVARALDLGNEAPPPGDDPTSKKAHEARQETAERCAVILRALSTQGESVCLMLMRDVRLVPMMQSIVSTCCPGRRQVQACKHVILAFYNITSCRVSIEEDENTSDADGDGQIAKLNESEGMRGLDAMVISGVVPLLIRLSTDGGSDMAPACAVALAHIKHRIKERLALVQAQEVEGAEQSSNLREFQEMDNLMEAGVVTALLAMFELDPAGIQRVDRLAAAMPPALAVLRAATEKDWTFLKGNSNLHFETPLPVCWDFRSSAIDDARFVPAEPRTFLAVLAPVVPPSGATIQDKIYGRFRILRVRSTKCLLRLENSRFAKLASALIGSTESGSAGSSASDLSDAIAMAISDDPGDNNDSDHERDHSRHGSSTRKSNVGSSAKSIAGSSSTDEDDPGSETRMPSPVKKKPTGRSLMMSRSPSHRGSGAFGLGSNSSTGSNTDSSNSLLRRSTSKAPAVRRQSRSMTHESMMHLTHSSSSMVNNSARQLNYGRKDSSQHRLGGDNSSSGVTLPKI
ncbi:Armadillo-type fold [Phytophthora cinnamomi]|uniref:Armadillo-type fold n=1 Tax=Phytophthora cinnamomi TaxID=4785 RepID=UPI00355A3485|nr:Armadillo-type fold [Phytophthora cinnamomi]